MKMSIEEFETKFFDPQRVKTFIENRETWINDYKNTDYATRWTKCILKRGSAYSGKTLYINCASGFIEMKSAMEIAMGILSTPKEEVQTSPIDVIEKRVSAKSLGRLGTEMLLDKIEASKGILKLMEEQQKLNIENAKLFAEMAKQYSPESK